MDSIAWYVRRGILECCRAEACIGYLDKCCTDDLQTEEKIGRLPEALKTEMSSNRNEVYDEPNIKKLVVV